MGVDRTRVVCWEGKGTGGTSSGVLGDGLCRGCSATSVFCSEFRTYCLDLVGEDTGVRGGLHALALKARSFCRESGLLSGDLVRLDLAGANTGGRGDLLELGKRSNYWLKI